MKANVKESDRYLKIVEWSDEDQCYVGRSPGLFFGGCHGDDQVAVYAELCGLVDEIILDMKECHEPLPAATAGKDYSGKFMIRTKPEIHQRLAIAAMQHNQSLNKYCIEQLDMATR